MNLPHRLLAVAIALAACAPVDEDVAATSTAAATACTVVALKCNGDGSTYRTAPGGGTSPTPTDTATPLELVQRACTTSTDCGIALLPLNSCGASRAYGVNRSALATFALSVDYCLSQYVSCRSLTTSIVAEDGRYAPKAASVAVRCCAGVCATYVPTFF